jgi:hypothetical protein
LVSQLSGLERRVGRSGKDSIDHRPGSHDDLANAAAGACVQAVRAVGLKSSFPSTFTTCIVWNLVPWARTCFLLGGQVEPSDPTCLRRCAGYAAARAAYRAYASRTAIEDVVQIQVYTKAHFKPNAMQGRFMQGIGEEELGL